MPFSSLNNNWSNLAQYYNNPASFKQTSKPTYPSIRYIGFDDGLIRGGAINVGISSLRDTERISKFFLSGKGTLFTIKQLGLQQSNPALEEDFDTKGNTSDSTRQYSPLNTTLQVPINALGGHLRRNGTKSIGGVGFFEGTSKGDGYNYEQIAIKNNINQGTKVKFVRVNGGDDKSKYTNPNRLINHYSSIIAEPGGQQTLLSYNGGAKSVYGLGITSINTTNIRTTLGLFNSSSFSLKLNGFSPFSSKTLSKQIQVDLNSSLADQLYKSPLYKNRVNTSDGKGNLSGSYDIESRIGTSGHKINNTLQDTLLFDLESGTYIGEKTKTTKYNVDSINVISIVDNKTFYTNSLISNNDPSLPKWALEKGDKNIGGKFGRDIIKFRFEFLNNDVPVSGGDINTDVLAFRAYIDDFSDGMSAKWDPYRYMGRGEEFYVYSGFTRDISVAFTIYAHSPEEMAPIYKKLNYLLSTFTPDYSDANKMRGNIGYLTVGDYLYRQPGVFTDIKLSGMLDTHWEIALDSPEGGEGKNQYEVPKHIKASMSFKPIHTFLPRKAKYKDGKAVAGYNTPFITLDKKAYSLQSNKYLD
jgi:hypothetical protein